MPKIKSHQKLSVQVDNASEIKVGDVVWFSRFRVNTIPVPTVLSNKTKAYLKGKVEHIEPVHGTTCLVSFEHMGEKYFSTIVIKSLWKSKKSLMDYAKTLSDFRVGDLVHVSQNEYDKNTGTYMGLFTTSGIVVKTFRQSPFLNLLTETGVKTVHKDFCIVLSRQNEDNA